MWRAQNNNLHNEQTINFTCFYYIFSILCNKELLISWIYNPSKQQEWTSVERWTKYRAFINVIKSLSDGILIFLDEVDRIFSPKGYSKKGTHWACPVAQQLSAHILLRWPMQTYAPLVKPCMASVPHEIGEDGQDVSSGQVFLSKKRRIGGRCELKANVP